MCLRWLRPERLLAAAASLLLAGNVAAQQPSLQLPLRCAPGDTCWISNHVDLDPGPGARDYACGALTYDAHNGTDLALRDLEAMRSGVAVVAAAAGVVRGARDGMADASVRETGRNGVRDRECGNGVRIAHDAGWETQYCHLRRGSVRVRRGEQVPAGRALGLVGLSGLTEYPHLHFTVRHEGRAVDPFRGLDAQAPCGRGERPLWDAATVALLPYAPGAIYNYGVASAMPRAADARAGRHRARVLARDAAAVVVWLEIFGVAAGDALSIEIFAPGERELLRHSVVFEKAQARVFRAAGRKRGAVPWPPGAYRAQLSVQRARESAAPPAVVRLSFDIQ